MANSRLHEEKMSLQTDLSQTRQDGTGREARLRSLGAELASAKTQCAQLKKEVAEVREFEQTRARQQARKKISCYLNGVCKFNPLPTNDSCVHRGCAHFCNKPIRIYMCGLILGVNTLYMFFCSCQLWLVKG